MSLPVADPTLFADAGSLASLKRQAAAHNPQALREAAQQFESLFIDMMLKSMRAANFKDPLFGSDQQRFYQGLYDQQLSIELSKSNGFGLADMLVQQLRRQGAGNAAGSQASPSGAAAAGSQTGAATDSKASAQAGASGASSLSGVSPSQQVAFARELWPDAQRAAGQLGVSPVSLIAQAALETDWGRRMPRSANGQVSNNLFGIKASGTGSGPSVTSATQEYLGSGPSTVQARFRAYGSCGECFQDYTALLTSNPRYAAALGTGGNVGAFAAALQQGGYATDPDYARKLTAVADTLTRTLAAGGAAQPLKLASGGPIPTSSSTL